jgi:hypothetical protein
LRRRLELIDLRLERLGHSVGNPLGGSGVAGRVRHPDDLGVDHGYGLQAADDLAGSLLEAALGDRSLRDRARVDDLGVAADQVV